MKTIFSVLLEKIKRDKSHFFENAPTEKKGNQLLRNILGKKFLIERIKILNRRNKKLQKRLFFNRMRKLNDDDQRKEIKKYVFFKLIIKTINLQMKRFFVLKNTKSIYF